MFGKKQKDDEELDLEALEIPTLDDGEDEPVAFEFVEAPEADVEVAVADGGGPEVQERVDAAVEQFTAEMDALRDDLASMLREELEDALGPMQDRLEETQVARDEALEDLAEARDTLADRETALEDLRHEVADLKEELDDRKIKVAELEVRMEDRDAALAELTSDLEQARSKLLNITDIVGPGVVEDAAHVAEFGDELPDELLANVQPLDDE